MQKHYYGVVLHKLLYTRRDQTRGNVVAGERGSWECKWGALRGAKYREKERLDNYFQFD